MQTAQLLEKVRHTAADAYTGATQVGRQAMDLGLRLIRGNPRSSLIGALALGALAAWAFWRHPAAALPAAKRRRRHA